MALIHGSQGLIYFVHQFKPRFREAALLDDPEMLAAVTALNRQITRLAPVLNSPTLQNVATVCSSNPEIPVAVMAKRDSGHGYLFAFAMREGRTEATFDVKDMAGHEVEVLDENRTLTATHGRFTDSFGPWDVHLYRYLSRRSSTAGELKLP